MHRAAHVLFVALFLTLSGCGDSESAAARSSSEQSSSPAPEVQNTGHLSRATAAHLLEASAQLKRFTKAFEFLVGRQASSVNMSEYSTHLYGSLMRAGYVDSSGADDAFHALPKASGDDFACQPHYCKVTVARAGDVEVTGVSHNQRGGAEVEFNWRWVLTEPGNELRKAGLDFGLRNSLGIILVDLNLADRRTGQALMKLWDDGWRVENVSIAR